MFRTKGRFDNRKFSEYLRSNKKEETVSELPKPNTTVIPGKGFSGNDIIFKVQPKNYHKKNKKGIVLKMDDDE
jgi:hypothetical protein